MEKFVKIKRPYSLAEFKIKNVNGKQYLECVVLSKEKDNFTSIECFATQTATEQILDIVREYEREIGASVYDTSGTAWNKLDPLVACWLTVNERGHTVSFARKEK